MLRVDCLTDLTAKPFLKSVFVEFPTFKIACEMHGHENDKEGEHKGWHISNKANNDITENESD